MQNKLTIAEVAKKAGVSPATISRVLNDRPGVGPELREKILKFIDEIDYKPNTLARSFTIGSINIIALILGDMRNPFYADLTFHMQKILNDAGYMVMTFNSEYDVKKEIEFIELSRQFNFAGLVLITAQSEELQSTLSQVEMPVVLVNRTLPDYTGDMVCMDNFQAGYLATKHLIELGHQSVSFITGHNTSSAGKQRFEGYQQVLLNYNLPFDPNSVFKGDLTLESGYEIASQYCDRIQELPSAIVATNDLMAIGFISRIKELGVDVPNRVSVVGVDNIFLSKLPGIDLTTIDQQSQMMAEHAASLMLRRIEEPEAAPKRIIIDPKLIIRGTTAPYKN